MTAETVQNNDRQYPKTEDKIAILAFIICAAIVIWHRSVYDNWLTEYDIFTYFLPWYGLLGERLRDFDIPGWTPYFSSGSPVAGDPSGGWMYMPVMIPFTFLSVESAFKAMIALQLLIGGTSTFVFARVIGFSTLAASMSMFTFAFGPFLYGQTQYATVGGQVSTWIPVGLLAVEKAYRSSAWAPKILWWALSGFALSQMAVTWPGQGLINGALVVVGWIFYRYLFVLDDQSDTMWPRIKAALGTTAVILVLGFGLSAAGLLPRMATNLESSIPGGDYSQVRGGGYLEDPHDLASLLRDFLVNDLNSRPVAISGVLFTLMILGLLLSHNRYGVPFFGTVLAIGLLLSSANTPLHRVFYLIPEFESIHHHSPRRLLWVLFLAPSMLAGAAVQVLPSLRHKPPTKLIVATPLFLVILVDTYLTQRDIWIGATPYFTVIVTTLLVLVVVSPLSMPRILRRNHATEYALIAMIFLAFIFPTGRDIQKSIAYDHPRGTLLSRDAETQDLLDKYVSRTDPGGAGEYLQSRANRAEPFRYVGYAGRNPQNDESSYSTRRRSSDVVSSLLNGRPYFLGLEHIAGYNPVHLQHYVDYIDTMNGDTQDYHWLDPYPTALLGSELLNMLNVRFIVVSNAEEEFLQAMDRAEYAQVFINSRVTVFENPNALPRAWIVHQVLPNMDGEGLRQIATGSANPREVAFVDGDLSALQQSLEPGNGSEPMLAESVNIISHQGDRVVAEVTANAPGLAVFSEVYARGWNAFVDGKPTSLFRTNHALRGVAVPRGTHVLELVYAPKALTVGLWCTGITGVALFGVVGVVISDRIGVILPSRTHRAKQSHSTRSLFPFFRSRLPFLLLMKRSSTLE